jgi:hypothetical protein
MLQRCVVSIVALTWLAASAAVTAADQAGQALDALKRLPDWSGVWAHYRDPSSPDRDVLKLTPKYAAIVQKARTEKPQANLSNCLPAGSAAVLQHAILHEYLFTPGRVTMLFEDGEVRRIHTDGRQHLALSELNKSFMGDSLGRWEGQTLVVDTIGFPYGEIWANYGVRATRNSRMVERIHLNAKGRMQIDTVLTDAAIFSEPYRYTREYERVSLPMTEPTCAVNNRDTGTEMDLTPPPED